MYICDKRNNTLTTNFFNDAYKMRLNPIIVCNVYDRLLRIDDINCTLKNIVNVVRENADIANILTSNLHDISQQSIDNLKSYINDYEAPWYDTYIAYPLRDMLSTLENFAIDDLATTYQYYIPLVRAVCRLNGVNDRIVGGTCDENVCKEFGYEINTWIYSMGQEADKEDKGEEEYDLTEDGYIESIYFKDYILNLARNYNINTNNLIFINVDEDVEIYGDNNLNWILHYYQIEMITWNAKIKSAAYHDTFHTMFKNCPRLIKIGFGTSDKALDISTYQTIDGMFDGDINLTNISFYCILKPDVLTENIFNDCGKIEKIFTFENIMALFVKNNNIGNPNGIEISEDSNKPQTYHIKSTSQEDSYSLEIIRIPSEL